MNPDDAGEPVCFLSELDEAGIQLDPRRAIRLAEEGSNTADDLLVLVSLEQDTRIPGSLWLPQLAPQSGEDLERYCERLETPVCRTAAWRIALQAHEGPIALRVTGSQEHSAALLAYVRGLLV